MACLVKAIRDKSFMGSWQPGTERSTVTELNTRATFYEKSGRFTLLCSRLMGCWPCHPVTRNIAAKNSIIVTNYKKLCLKRTNFQITPNFSHRHPYHGPHRWHGGIATFVHATRGKKSVLHGVSSCNAVYCQ